MACICGLFAFVTNVYADEEAYYTNGNGVEFTEEEYEFLSAMYWDGYQDLMTEDDYDEFIRSFHETGIYPTEISEDGLAYNDSVGKIREGGGYSDSMGGGTQTNTGYSTLYLLPLLH